MWRGITIGACFAVFVVGGVSGQSQRSPATLDDLLSEIRGLRADVNQGSQRSIQADLLIGRLQIQEQRITLLSRQLYETRQRLAVMDKQSAPALIELNHAEEVSRSNPPSPEGSERHLDHLRAQIAQDAGERYQLRRQETDFANALAAEQNRWTEFNSRLDDLERALSR